jgi:hypothetical protein
MEFICASGAGAVASVFASVNQDRGCGVSFAGFVYCVVGGFRGGGEAIGGFGGCSWGSTGRDGAGCGDVGVRVRHFGFC